MATGLVNDVKSGSTNNERVQYRYDTSGNVTHEYTLNGGLNNGLYRAFDKLGRATTETRRIDSTPTNGGAAITRDVSRIWAYPVVAGKTTTVFTDRNGAITQTVVDPATLQRTTTSTSGVATTLNSSYSSTVTLNRDGSSATAADRTTINSAVESESRLTFIYDTAGRVNRTQFASAFLGTAARSLQSSIAYYQNGLISENEVLVGTSTLLSTGPTTGAFSKLLTEHYAFDALGRLTSADQDFAGGLANTGHAKKVEIRYDHLGNRTYMGQSTSNSQTGGLQATSETVIDYSTDGRLDLLTHRLSTGQRLVEFDPQYNASSRIRSRATSYWDGANFFVPVFTENTTYTYDTSGRLSGSNRQGVTNDYQWTPAATRNDDGKDTGLEGRIKSDSSNNYRYDEEGNLTGQFSKSSQQKVLFFYDSLNRLTVVDNYDTSGTRVKSTEYGYDVSGNRFAERVKTFGSSITTTTRYRLFANDNEPIVQYNDNSIDQIYFNDPQANSLWAVDRIVAGATTTSWAYASQGGTVTSWLTLGATQAISHLVYDDYGNTVNELTLAEYNTADLLPNIWSGMWRMAQSSFASSTEPLFELNGVWYQPRLGMYLSPTTSDAHNPYRFGGGDPISRGESWGAHPQSSEPTAWQEYSAAISGQSAHVDSLDWFLYRTGQISRTVGVIAGSLTGIGAIARTTGGVIWVGAILLYEADMLQSGAQSAWTGRAVDSVGGSLIKAALGKDSVSGHVGAAVYDLAGLVGALRNLSAVGRIASANAVDDVAHAIQRGGVQTPKVGLIDRWKLYFENRQLIAQLKKKGIEGDVLLDSLGIERTKAAVFKKIGDLTAGSGNEIALLRTQKGLVLRMGTPKEVPLKGAIRILAHSHPDGRLGFSTADWTNVFVRKRGLMKRELKTEFHSHKSTILIGPSGAWRRYSANQTILGGSF